MSKPKLTVRVDKQVKEQAKKEYNLSKEIEQHLKNLVQQPDTIEERIEQINEEIEESKNIINEEQTKISNLQSKRQRLKNELENQSDLGKQEKRFLKVCNTKMQENDWRSPEDIKAYWVREMDKDKEELWEWAKEQEMEV